MGLTAYRRKRNFRATPEPSGSKARSRQSRKLSFVIQKHDATRLHYDFRLELDGVLKSWAVPKGPSLDPSEKRLAVEVEDHPLEYGGFEGVIPEKQYGAGPVLLWDRGTWRPRGDAKASLSAGKLDFELHGKKLGGSWKLVRMGGRHAASERSPSWLLIKARDDWARPEGGEIVVERPESVRSRKTIEEIGGSRRRGKAKATAAAKRSTSTPKPRNRASSSRSRHGGEASRVEPGRIAGARSSPLPDRFAPQLATLVDAPPSGEGWLHEIKFDGFRVLCRLENGRATLITRNGNDWTDHYPPVAEAAARLPLRQALLDGEVVMLQPDGTTNFQALQNATRHGGDGALTYFAFDLLHLDGYDLSRAPLVARKEALAKLLGKRAGQPTIRYSDHVEAEGARFLAEACGRGLEGMISKRRDAPYHHGRSLDWLKTKCQEQQELVIGGFTEPTGSRTGLGALLLGVHEKGRLRYAGRVGTGFSNRTLTELSQRLRRLEVERSPFADPPRGRGTHWVKPQLVAQVSFTGWTNDGRLRHPSFLGLREDRPAREIVRERKTQAPAVAGPSANTFRGVTLSNPDKVLYPEQGLTKLDLARYFDAAADRMLPHVADRPLMLLRCPEGRGKQCFFQKHPSGTVPDVLDQVEVQEKHDRGVYLVVREPAGIVALAQMGALEIHAWGARADRLENPDRLAFDLDPGPDVAWEQVVGTARRLRAILEHLGLESFLKTTGGKGLHIVLPIERTLDWKSAGAFADAVGALLVSENPDGLTAHASKARRHGKIFVDTLRNRRGATWVVPYSTRAREGAPVSMPIDWKDLTTRLSPAGFNVRNAPARIGKKPDPWARMEKLRQRITAAMVRDAGRRKS